jgi:hypothetical protein
MRRWHRLRHCRCRRRCRGFNGTFVDANLRTFSWHRTIFLWKSFVITRTEALIATPPFGGTFVRSRAPLRPPLKAILLQQTANAEAKKKRTTLPPRIFPCRRA